MTFQVQHDSIAVLYKVHLNQQEVNKNACNSNWLTCMVDFDFYNQPDDFYVRIVHEKSDRQFQIKGKQSQLSLIEVGLGLHGTAFKVLERKTGFLTISECLINELRGSK